MQPATAQQPNPHGGAKRHPAPANGNSPPAKRPAAPNTAPEPTMVQTRSIEDITRAILRLEAKVIAVEEWIPVNNQTIDDHANKLDTMKRGLVQWSLSCDSMSDRLQVIEQEIQNTQVALETNDGRFKAIVENNDAALKHHVQQLEVMVREQFLITQQYADKGIDQLRREVKDPAGPAPAPHRGNADGVQEVRSSLDQFAARTVD